MIQITLKSKWERAMQKNRITFKQLKTERNINKWDFFLMFSKDLIKC